jgi:hypothetical protein
MFKPDNIVTKNCGHSKSCPQNKTPGEPQSTAADVNGGSMKTADLKHIDMKSAQHGQHQIRKTTLHSCLRNK